MLIGKKEKNRLLQPNAWHHRSDALSSVAALIGIEGAQLGYPFLDPLAGLVVSALIMKTAWDMGKQSVDELTDAVTGPEVESRVYQLMSDLERVQDFHEVRVRRMGSYLLVDLHIEVDEHLTFFPLIKLPKELDFELPNLYQLSQKFLYTWILSLTHHQECPMKRPN